MDIMKKILLTLFIFSFLSGCEKPAPVNKSLLHKAIIEASVINYEMLSPTELNNVYPNPRYFGVNENWSNGTVFVPKNAFYVRARLDRNVLAKLSLAFSCGSAANSRACTEKKLVKAIKKLFSYKPRMLYGKYKNRWEFIGNAGLMPETEKYEGHGLISLNTSNDGLIDTVLIGPLPVKPKTMVISFYYGYKIDGLNYDATYHFENGQE
jgi:hypothetical protein